MKNNILTWDFTKRFLRNGLVVIHMEVHTMQFFKSFCWDSKESYVHPHWREATKVFAVQREFLDIGKRNQIMFLIRIHYDDGNTVLFISVADWSCIWAYFMYLCILALYLHSCSTLALWSHISCCWNYIEYNVKWNACRQMALSAFLKPCKVCFSDFCNIHL